jgi:hypothetical protein
VDLPNFKKMMGKIGESFMGERMFYSMKKGPLLNLEDWIVYYDIVYHGTQEEKN